MDTFHFNFVFLLSLCISANGRCRLKEQTRVGKIVCNITEEVDLPKHTGNASWKFGTMQKAQYKTYFRLDDRTGIIRVSNPIDREEICPRRPGKSQDRCTLDFRFAIYVTRDKPLFRTVTIEIEDINDHAPSFVRKKITKYVREDVPQGYTISLVHAVDPDAGAAGHVKYSIEGEDKASFMLDDGINGDELRLKSVISFDRETRSSYHFTIVAKDGGTPSLSGSLSVIVKVTDVNDHKPIFVNINAIVDVPEHDNQYSFRERQISMLKATDEDENSHITYNIGSPADPAIERNFGVTSEGALMLKRPLNYDLRQEYRVPVVAVDSGTPPASTTATVTVRVTDVNNNKPEIEFQTWRGNRLEVKENKPPHTFVATITVRDMDTGDFGTVSCLLAENSYFALEQLPTSPDSREREFKLLTRVSFDREERSQRDLTITCHDGGTPDRRSSTKHLTVYITDENDNGPQFEQSIISAEIWENELAGTEVLKVKAKDPDSERNARVIYKLKEGYEGLFSIDEKSGRVIIQSQLDREKNQTVVFEVIAFDAKDHTKNTTAKVVVRVKDKNDCPPIFEQNYTFKVRENEVGTQVGTVKATDNDSGKNGRIYYRLKNMEKLHYWRLTDDGHLFVANKLDREEQDEYSLVVLAQDGGSPALTSSALVQIIVLDKNDHAPTFEFPNQVNDTVNISSDTKPGKLVAQVRAKDDDSGDNGRVEYAINDKLTHNSYFQINSQTGDIFLTKTIASQTDRVFKLVVTARDNGTPPRTGYKVLTIRFKGGQKGRKGPRNIRTQLHESEGPITREVLITFGIGLAVILMVVLAALILYFCHQTTGRHRRRNRNIEHGTSNGQSVTSKNAFLRVCPCFKERQKTTKEQSLYEEGVLTPMKKDGTNQPPPTAQVAVFPDGTVKRMDEYDAACYTKIDPNVQHDATSIYPYGQLSESELGGYSLYAPGNTHVHGGTMKPPVSSPEPRKARFPVLDTLDTLEKEGRAEVRDEGRVGVDPTGTALRKGRNNVGYSVRSPYLASSFV